MKKIVLNRTIRNIIVILLICGTLIFSYGMYYAYSLPLQEQNVSVFNYKQKANVNYSVFYKPNILSDKTSIEEGNVYITNYVDYINTVINYNYTGERNAKIQGNYSITAVVEAQEVRNDEENEFKTIWSKDFELVPETSFSVSDVTFSLQKELPVYLTPFQDFVQQVIEESKVGGNHRLTVKWDINLEAETDRGIVKENLTPSLIIPLRNSYFEIGGEQTIEKPGSIEEVIHVEDPRKQSNIVIFSVLDVLCLVILIFVFMRTVPTNPDKLNREIKRIFKRHGERLVELDTHSRICFDSKDLWSVKSFEDLVRIADEISKPIVYQYDNSAAINVPVFYVFDDQKAFVYKLAIYEPAKKPLAKNLTKSEILS